MQPFCPSESWLIVTSPPPQAKPILFFCTHMKTGFEENALRLKTEDWQQENVNLINWILKSLNIPLTYLQYWLKKQLQRMYL